LSSSGRIIFLHGASSSGKSTLARAVQAQIGAPFWHFSIDHLRDAGVVPLARFKSGEFRWAEKREAFFDGFHRTLPAIAGAGNDLIVEHIIETDAWLDRLLRLLDGFDVFLAVLDVPLAELERREIARGDRPVGDAKRDFESLPTLAHYDLKLESSLVADASAATLISAWSERQTPSAFDRLRTGRTGA
jgi:chloramphenicol 3-O phosphotransferase